MSRSLRTRLPDAVRALLDGTDLASRIGLTVLLLTVDDAGWPHVAMLSVGEILATDDQSLRIALWLHSRATTNLDGTRRGVLVVVADGAACYMRVHGTRGVNIDLRDQGRLAYFLLRIEEVLEDVVPYATLTSGITFELKAPEQVVARWQHTIGALRRAPAPTGG